jgi:tRNA(fMet)-specific endonuclease VapC
VVILDTDALTILFRAADPLLPRLESRLLREPRPRRVTTVVCVQEVFRGWLSHINAARTPDQLLFGYDRLRVAVEGCSQMELLPYDAAAHRQFDALRKTCRRLGTMDLRIACVCLVHNATLLTRNLRDFRQVPGLTAEDWSRSP